MRTTKAKTLVTLAEETYVMVLRSVGNPDFGQYAPVSEPEAVKGGSLAAMVRAAREYIAKWNLGGGNFVDPEVRTLDGKSVGWISYNGRVWDKNPLGARHAEAQEIRVA